ncbi:hypothetical protein GGS20DRAFT_588592 [Poronia punctata]|nr:hypothetical protein GGS20DRAFT_588592 [Poronia punctata]
MERTVNQPRDKALHTVVLEQVEQVNDETRVFRLGIPQGSSPIRFLPGQWLDVYVPDVEKAGGFTITSTPREARLPHPRVSSSSSGHAEAAYCTTDEPPLCRREEEDKGAPSLGPGQKQDQGPYLELAVQKSPGNLPAAWLWRDPPSSIVGRELRVRVGGGFVWPPPGVNVRALRRVVFVAGGVGVNPLVSMLTSLASAQTSALEVHFFYSLKDPRASGRPRIAKNLLFLDRIAGVFREKKIQGQLHVYLTDGGITKGPSSAVDGPAVTGKRKRGVGDDGRNQKPNLSDNESVISCEGGDIPFHLRRCTVEQDVAATLGTLADRRLAVVYVCGVPTMTDEFLAKLTDRNTGLSMEPHRVLHEKWW